MKKNLVSAFIFLILFISPQTLTAILPKEFQKPYLLLLFAGYTFCGIFLFIKRALFSNRNLKPLILTSCFIVLGSINLFVHKSTATFNILGPLIAYMGYCFFNRKYIDLRAFMYFLIIMYVFYYFAYYSILPDLFFRPGFDEDAEVFDMSSSNAIPISLNITLYSYIICDRFYHNENKNNILVFALINFVLIVIQQSRAGLLVSSVILIIASYHFSKKWFVTCAIIVFILTGVFVITYLEIIQSYLEIIGEIDTNALEKDVRGEAQSNFFKNISLREFIFGHNKKIYASYSHTEITYTYNVFLDMWDKYGILINFIFLGLFIHRVIRRHNFEFPLYYFIPFFMYSMVESIFFPNFWDCIIYVILFVPKINELHNNITTK
jgi:hypothetical protein